MPFKRRFSRGRAARKKYSIERRFVSGNVPGATQTSVVVVPATTVQGKRTVSHMEIQPDVFGEVGNAFYWAIVYVPSGTTPSTMSLVAGSSSLYEPSQFVHAAGIYSGQSEVPFIWRSPIRRTLNEGDQIVLLIAQGAGDTALFEAMVKYAISF